MKLADGFEKAFVGSTISAFTRRQVALYDRDMCIWILMERDGMREDEAIDFFDFNVIGSWVGEDTPLFIKRYPIDKIQDYIEV